MWAAQRLEENMKSSDNAPSCMIHIFLSYIYPTLQSNSILYFLELQHYPTLLFNLQCHRKNLSKSRPDIFHTFIKEIGGINPCFINPHGLSRLSSAYLLQGGSFINIYSTLCQSLLILFKFNATIILETSQISNMLNTMYFLFRITY